MQRQKRRNTAAELAVRRAVYALGLRYRLHRRPLNGLRRSADLVFSRAKVAVFVDGCFWHGCPEHGTARHTANSWYWPEKIASNARRDVDTDERLRAAGWMPIRIWEHDDPEAAAQRVALAVRTRQASSRSSHI